MFGLVELGLDLVWFGLVWMGRGGGGSNHNFFLCLYFCLVNPMFYTENCSDSPKLNTKFGLNTTTTTTHHPPTQTIGTSGIFPAHIFAE